MMGKAFCLSLSKKWRMMQLKLSRRHFLLSIFTLLVLLGFAINYNTLTLVNKVERKCPPRKNVFFLKTHKCAGSSIQNILLRYGEKHNLNFALPQTDNYFGHPAHFSASLLPKPRLPVYNILTHHSRMNFSEARRLMPKDTLFVTILRDPVELFESSYSYFSLSQFYNATIIQFAKFNSTNKEIGRRLWNRFGINQMIFDMGAEPGIFWNESMVTSYIDQIESWFDLVLLADRFTESLVLLKDLMCWETDDVVVFRLNALNPKYKSNLTNGDRSLLRKLNAADQILYDRFSKRIDERIASFGIIRMTLETRALLERTEQWYNYCVQGVEPQTSKRHKYYLNLKTLKFKPRVENKNITCKLLIEQELSFTDYLRRKQKFKILQMRQRRKMQLNKHDPLIRRNG